MERCLELAPEHVKAAYITELTESEQLICLIKNQYGNYVIQKALAVSFGEGNKQLLIAIEKCAPLI